LKKLLITGGAGFIGSNLAIKFKNKFPGMDVIVLDNLKRRGSELNIIRLKNAGVTFHHGDIRNKDDMESLQSFDCLIECSAEPSVLSGFGGSPEYLINTNLVGAINCFEVARKNNSDVIFLSSSRVYPHKELNLLEYYEDDTRYRWKNSQRINYREVEFSGISEDFPLNGARSMYGATKLAAEFLLHEYADMYGIRVVINRCGVVAGPWQFGKVDQGVFTLWMLNHYFGKSLQYIGFNGHGKQTRDLLSIDDLFDLMVLELQNLDKINGKVYNVGGGEECSLSLCETTSIAQLITGNTVPIGKVQKERPADIRLYLTDNKKIYTDLNWKPKKNAHTILNDIYEWIKANESQLKSI